MATATIVKVWKDSTAAYIAARVAEGAENVEYLASTPLLDSQGQAKTAPQLKTDLTAALTVVRNAQLATPATVAGILGTITI